MATAELLGQQATVFPSHHGGFIGGEFGYAGQPEAFARKLRDVLDEDARPRQLTFRRATLSTCCGRWRSTSSAWSSVTSTSSILGRKPGRTVPSGACGSSCGCSSATSSWAPSTRPAPIRVGRPLWRVDLLESVASAPGSLDRAHHHPRLRDWEPGRRVFVEELSKDPVSWLRDRFAAIEEVLKQADAASFASSEDVDALRAAGPMVVGVVEQSRLRRGGSRRPGPGRCRRLGPLKLALTHTPAARRPQASHHHESITIKLHSWPRTG